jgi:hypothetical protein
MSYIIDSTPLDPTQEVLSRVCLQAIENIRFDRTARERWENEGGAVEPIKESPWIYLVAPLPDMLWLENLMKFYERQIVQISGRGVSEMYPQEWRKANMTQFESSYPGYEEDEDVDLCSRALFGED